MKKGLFVIGTGTDVGKTYVTGLLLRQMRERGIDAGYFKAALSGAVRQPDGRLLPGDAWQVCRRAGIPVPPEELVCYCYEAAVSPHLAAQWEGDGPQLPQIEHQWRRLQERFDFLVAEGSGGIVCPLRRDEQGALDLLDVIRLLDYDAVLVSGAGLGAINACVLTAHYAKYHGVSICGIVLNGYRPDEAMHRDNRRMVEQMTGIAVVGCVQPGDERLREDLSCLWEA